MNTSEKKMTKRDLIFLSVKAGMNLWGVSPSLRAISIGWDECSINIYFIYDKAISDDAEETSECIATQVLADFSFVKAFRTHHIQCDFPHPIPQFGQEVYRREEQNDESQPSHLTYPDPEALLKEYAGTGKAYGSYEPGETGFKEVIECDEIIGEWFDRNTKKYLPTKRATIHYDKNGNAFFVPSNPKSFSDTSKLMEIIWSFSRKYLSKKDLLLLSIKAGLNLWGVSPNLRMVNIGWNKNSINIYFIYDSVMSDEVMEISECAATEVQADFSFEPVRTHHMCCEVQNLAQQLGQECVYCKENQWKEK